MIKETLTLHAALATLKTLEGRIEKAIKDARENAFINAKKTNCDTVTNITVKDWAGSVEAKWQSLTDMMKRQAAIKKALLHKNATTTYTIGNETFSISDMLYFKQGGLLAKESLLLNLKNQLVYVNNYVETENNRVETQADQQMIAVYGSKEKAVAANEALGFRKAYIDANKMEVVNPIKIETKIEELEKEIFDFRTNVEGAIAYLNATTQIEIEY